MTDYIQIADEQNPGAEPLSVERLRSHARTAARSWGVIRQARGRGTFRPRVEAARASINKLYEQLDKLPPPDYSKITGPDPILQLRENPRLLRAAVLEAASLRRKIPRLPRVITKAGQESGHPDDQQGEVARAAVAAGAFFDATYSIWHAEAFRVYLDQLQRDDPFDLEELSALPTFFKFHLLEEILAQAQ